MTGNMAGKLIRAGFDNDPLSMCQVGPFNGTSTQVTDFHLVTLPTPIRAGRA
jgi:hypothetical protein